MAPARIHSIDFLRGLIMAIMITDHVREYFYASMALADPMDLNTVDAASFFTRWLAHFCAPIFVFLTGLSAYLHASRHQLTKNALSAFLLKRGALLIALELTIINFAWTFTFPPEKQFLQVIWAIGVSMIALSALIWLPWRALMAVAVIIIAGHNLLDPVHFSEGAMHWIWAVLHDRSVLQIGDVAVRTSYPVLPWIGVMALGYGFGKWFMSESRKTILLVSGSTMCAAFILLRLWGGYGETNPWQVYENDAVKTLMSFLNLTKYPPSLLFILMTLGPALLLLQFAERFRGRLHDAIIVLGRVPLFYYIVHLYALHLVYRLSCVVTGHGWKGGLDIGTVWGVWGISLLILLAIFPLMARFARLKAQKRSPILSYF